MNKKLEDFPAVPLGTGWHLVCELYPSVTFSETRTFDLMRLLYAYRKGAAKFYYLMKMLIELEVREEQVKGNKLEPYFLFIKQHGRLPESKYSKALKAELAKREPLTKHEKRAAYKLKYVRVN